MKGYDLIGDIHAHASTLFKLLESLGYENTGGYYHHPHGRKVIFLGDLPDRGNEHAETFDLVRSMLDNNQAWIVMGNHEFFAIKLDIPELKEKLVRDCKENNVSLAGPFQAAYPMDSASHRELTEWFKSFPLFMEFGGGAFRVVHACWDDNAISLLHNKLRKEEYAEEAVTAYYLTPKSLQLYAAGESDFRRAVDVLLKGPEIEAPPGVTYVDKRSQVKRISRVQWWKDPSSDPGWIEGDWYARLDEDTQKRILARYDENNPALRYAFTHAVVPTFIGHYYMAEAPHIVSESVCCLDFKGGITAYCIGKEGVGVLSPNNLVFQAYS